MQRIFRQTQTIIKKENQPFHKEIHPAVSHEYNQ